MRSRVRAGLEIATCTARLLLFLAVGLTVVAVTFERLAPRTLALDVPSVRRVAAVNLDWVSVSHMQLVDEHGRTILLRGFNTTALPEWPSQPVAPLDDEDTELVQQSGFNVVRLAV